MPGICWRSLPGVLRTRRRQTRSRAVRKSSAQMLKEEEMWKYSNRPYLAALILLSITFLATPLFRPVESAWAEDGGGLRVSPTSLTFTAPAGGTAPPAQHVSVSSGTARNFTVTTSATWLTATPTSGKTPATLTVSANPAHLTPGTYTGSIRVSVPNSETSRHVSVTFTVTASGDSITLSKDRSTTPAALARLSLAA